MMKSRRNGSMTSAETAIYITEVLSKQCIETMKKPVEGNPAHPQDA